MNLLRKYWMFPVFIVVVLGYIYIKYDLQRDLRKRGKCTIGVVDSEFKFSSSHYRASIIYVVKNRKYTLIVPKSMMKGSRVNIVYDSLYPNKSAMEDSCIQNEVGDLKIDFFQKNW